jgi:hypothetical protein
MNQLIHCINCDAIYFKTPFDQPPKYDPHPSNSEDPPQVNERDDFQSFLKDHRGHQLEDLKVVEDSFISEKPYFEPVKVSYFKATNGRESFVIKKFRESIDEPLKYQLIIGDYSLRCVGIDIQSKEIAKQLERDFGTTPLPQAKITVFLKLYQHIAQTVDIRNLERIPEESPNPLEIYYKMDDLSLIYLLRNCRSIFKEQEYLDIEKFIHLQKEDGVLLLKATYKIEIIEKAKARKKVVVAPIVLQKKGVVEKA